MIMDYCIRNKTKGVCKIQYLYDLWALNNRGLTFEHTKQKTINQTKAKENKYKKFDFSFCLKKVIFIFYLL